MRASLVAVAASLVFGFVLVMPVPALAQQSCSAMQVEITTSDNVKRVETQYTPLSPCKDQRRWFITNTQCSCCGNCQFSDFVGLAVEASRFIFGITGSLALVMFAVGGFWWLTAAGSSERIEKGKKTFVAAVIGIGIIFGAWVLVNTILAALTGGFAQGPQAVITGDWWKSTR